MSAASATLMLGLLIGLPSPQRGLLLDGAPVNAADWVDGAFPRTKAKHYLNESVLARTHLQLFDEDAETRWRRFLDDGEAEQRIDLIVGFGSQAKDRLQNDPVPPSLAERLARLSLEADGANTRRLEMTAELRRLEREVEKAILKESIHHCLKYGHEVTKLRTKLSDGKRWPEKLARECDNTLRLLKQEIDAGVAEWVPRQTARSVAQASDFRHRSESEIRWLEALGYRREAQALEKQAASVLHRLSELERHSLTLAQAEDYPRQPKPHGNEPVIVLREDAKRGQDIAANLAKIQSLNDQERQAHIAAIERRVAQVQSVISAQEQRLADLSSIQITSEEGLREAVASVEQIRVIFTGDRNEDFISELARHLQRITEDLGAWQQGDLPPERLSVLLADQLAYQVSAFQEAVEADDDMDPPPWDLTKLYETLAAERVALAQRRSDEWMRPRSGTEGDIPTLSPAAAHRLMTELAAAPGFLAASAQEALARIRDSLQTHIEVLEEKERLAQITAWRGGFPELSVILRMEKSGIQELLKALSEPPWPLSGEVSTWRDTMAAALTAQLDKLSLDDLFERITRLSPEMRRQLLQRLEPLL